MLFSNRSFSFSKVNPCGWPAPAFATYAPAMSPGLAVASGGCGAPRTGQCRLSSTANQPQTCASQLRTIRLWRITSPWFQTGRSVRSSIVRVVRSCSRKLNPSRLPAITFRSMMQHGLLEIEMPACAPHAPAVAAKPLPTMTLSWARSLNEIS